ncbi:MAG: hypothetical protein M3P96_08190 [Actinomycetota bacterium]|nr:hypothetical protein [Actinomycetota bacterium]
MPNEQQIVDHALSILSTAQRQVDQLLAESQRQAERIALEAQHLHDGVVDEARATAQSLIEQVRAHATVFEREAYARVEAAVLDARQRRGALEEGITLLFEKQREEYERLRSYYLQRLEELVTAEEVFTGGSSLAPGSEGRVRAVLDLRDDPGSRVGAGTAEPAPAGAGR